MSMEKLPGVTNKDKWDNRLILVVCLLSLLLGFAGAILQSH